VVVDPDQPALLFACIVASVGFVITASGTARTLARLATVHSRAEGRRRFAATIASGRVS
jgi:hypothetical protein